MWIVTEAPGGAFDNPGQERATVDGVTFERGATVLLRPGSDRDPFDRILIAQALQHNSTLVTVDDAIRAYSVPLLTAT